MSLIPKPGVDQPGFCALCGEKIAEFDGPTIVRILSNARPMYVRLNDGSMMSVTLCAKCKDSFSVDDVQPLMESVYKGWVQSIELVNWSEERKADHLRVYGEKFITECDEKGINEDKLIAKHGELLGAVKVEEKRLAKEARDKIKYENVVSEPDGAGI